REDGPVAPTKPTLAFVLVLAFVAGGVIGWTVRGPLGRAPRTPSLAPESPPTTRSVASDADALLRSVREVRASVDLLQKSAGAGAVRRAAARRREPRSRGEGRDLDLAALPAPRDGAPGRGSALLPRPGMERQARGHRGARHLALRRASRRDRERVRQALAPLP